MKFIIGFLKWPFIFLLFFFCNFVFGDSLDISSDNCPDCIGVESILKSVKSVPDLAIKCKSKWTEPGCSEYEMQLLVNYILQHCGSVPEDTHHMNKQLLAIYVSRPMLNITLLRGWSWLNPDLTWPTCAVCLLDYPLDPYWERNFSFCQ